MPSKSSTKRRSVMTKRTGRPENSARVLVRMKNRKHPRHQEQAGPQCENGQALSGLQGKCLLS